MSEYRFIAFPKDVSPTAKEVAAFRGYAELLNDRVAYGKQRDGAGLAICCQAEPFDKLMGLDPKFASLLERWEKQGAEVVASLPFTRDKEPWREISPRRSTREKTPQPEPATPPGRPQRTAAKPLAKPKQPALAPSPRGSRSDRPWGRWLLYAAIILVAAGGFSVGGYLMGRQSEVDARVLQYLDELEQSAAEEENATALEGDRGVEGTRDGESSEPPATGEL